VSTNDQEIDELSLINNYQSTFNITGFKDLYLNENATVKWSSFKKLQTDSKVIYEFDISTSEKKAIINEMYSDTMYYSLIAYLNRFKQVQLRVLEWIPLKANKFNKPELLNGTNFSGLLNTFAIDGTLIQVDFYKAGDQKSRLHFEEIEVLKESIKGEKNLLKAPPVGGCDCWIPVWMENYTDWYQTASQGSGSITTYIGKEYTGKTLVYVYMPSDGGGGNGNYEQTQTRTAVHGPRYSSNYSSKSQFYDEQVLLDKSFASNEWLKCIYDRLVEIDAFRNALLKFTGEYPVIHLRFDVGDLVPNAEGINPVASTFIPINYLSRIRVNNKFSSNYSTLLMAKTLIHEVIHAEMYRKLMELASTPDGTLDKNKINQYLSNGDYPGLFYYYETYGFKLMQHELMAAHYVEIMSKILSDFDNNTYEYSYYQSLVWIGSLQKTVTYTKKDSTEKRDIDDAYFIEMTNGYRLCIEN